MCPKDAHIYVVSFKKPFLKPVEIAIFTAKSEVMKNYV